MGQIEQHLMKETLPAPIDPIDPIDPIAGMHTRAERAAASSPLRLAMIPWMVAGIKTHYLNVRTVAASLPDVTLRAFEVDPYIEGRSIERLPLLPHRVKANLRCQFSTLPALYATPLDVVWTQTLTSTLPFLFTRSALGGIPVVYDIDVTPHLLAAFGPYYAEQVRGSALKRRTVDALHRMALRRVAAVVAWSAWAARSFERDYGVDRERIHILPPGVDLTIWEHTDDMRRGADGRLPRLLFVGGDFDRKGGNLLLDVYRQHFVGRCELHLVTKADIPTSEGIIGHHDLTPNDPTLRHLYASCDALVLPTHADCFSLAAIEAMASSLPVITTAVGGIPEIVIPNETGYLVTPGNGAELRQAIEALLADSTLRRALGHQGRAIAEARFDANINARRLLDLSRAVRHP